MTFPKAEAVSRVKDPLDWSEDKCRLMAEACREMAVFHYGASPDIRAIYDRRGFDPGSIRSEEDIARIPAVGVSAMKTYLLTSLAHERAVLKLTSSGTRGQKTQIWLDQESLDRVQAMLDVLWEQEGLVSREPTNYLMFVYDPEDAQDLGIAFSCRNEQRFAPAAETFFAIKKDARGEWAFGLDAVLEKLAAFEGDGKPVRIHGMPGFIHEALAAMRAKGLRVRLPAGSFMLTGGGWKAAEDKKISRESFRELAAEHFGIPVENTRDNYGMAEHSAPYIECPKHRFHVPVYNRVLARDPASLEVLPPGRSGILELITPFNAMMPNLAILSTDLGSIDTEPCPCGRRSPTFSLAGRAGLVKHKGCAIHAGDIVRRGARVA
ncbi:MAG: acyl-protein synthetase [Elusimicrobia bacterium]|nr:acyl-protein synthetase [Elusimicrobiota bacterium]